VLVLLVLFVILVSPSVGGCTIEQSFILLVQGTGSTYHQPICCIIKTKKSTVTFICFSNDGAMMLMVSIATVMVSEEMLDPGPHTETQRSF
jgi:hypothetical protein